MMICDEVHLRESSSVGAVKQPLKGAACGRDRDNCLVAFSNLSIIDDYLEKEDIMEVEQMRASDLSSNNPRSSCNALKLDAATRQYKCLLFPPGLIVIIIRLIRMK